MGTRQSQRPYPLMTPTPTGSIHNVAHSQLRPEYQFQPDAVTIDAPGWMPAGGVFSWHSEGSDTTYMQPHGDVR